MKDLVEVIAKALVDHPDEVSVSEKENGRSLTVSIPPELLSRFPAEKRDALIGVLAQDPRPRYQTDASRVYGLEFGGYEVKFSVNGQKMTVTDITEKDS